MKCECCGQEVPFVDWPIKFSIGLHSSKDSVAESFADAFAEEGADFDKWEERNGRGYVYAGGEVSLEVEAYENGSYSVNSMEYNGVTYKPSS